MTDDEALSKDDTLNALRNDVLKLPALTLTYSGRSPLPAMVNVQDVLNLITKYFRS